MKYYDANPQQKETIQNLIIAALKVTNCFGYYEMETYPSFIRIYKNATPFTGKHSDITAAIDLLASTSLISSRYITVYDFMDDDKKNPRNGREIENFNDTLINRYLVKSFEKKPEPEHMKLATWSAIPDVIKNSWANLNGDLKFFIVKQLEKNQDERFIVKLLDDSGLHVTLIKELVTNFFIKHKYTLDEAETPKIHVRVNENKHQLVDLITLLKHNKPRDILEQRDPSAKITTNIHTIVPPATDDSLISRVFHKHKQSERLV